MGKNGYQNIIEQGKKIREKRLAEGWKETVDGLLPIDEIVKAGFILQNGIYIIPGQWYICEKSDGQYNKGDKYWGASKQYLEWRNNRKNKKKDTTEDYINKELERPKKAIPVNGEWDGDVSKVPF